MGGFFMAIELTGINRIYSGDQALFSQWDSLVKLAGHQQHQIGVDSPPRLVHMFHLVDPLGRSTDGNLTPHVTNEYFSFDDKEVQPAWFAVSDTMPLLTLETTTPYSVGKFLGGKFESIARSWEQTSETFDDDDKVAVNEGLKQLGYPLEFPTTVDAAYRGLTTSNWYGIVDSAEKSASSHNYDYIDLAQRQVILRHLDQNISTLPKEKRAEAVARVRQLAHPNGALYQGMRGKDLTEVAHHTFTTIAAEIERLTNISLKDIDLTESTQYFAISGDHVTTANQIDPSQDRFKFFDWYIANKDLYTDAHNKVSSKLSNAGENPINTLSANKGETPFWIIVDGKKSKLFVHDDSIIVGDRQIRVLDQPLEDHGDLARELSELFKGQEVALVPTAIPLILQLRANGSVLLPERGSSYVRQVDMVWDHIVENGTPKAVRDLDQQGIVRVHPHAISSLPSGERIKLPWYLEKDFTQDTEGFTTTDEIKARWHQVVVERQETITRVTSLPSIVEKARALFSDQAPNVVTKSIASLNEVAKKELFIKTERGALMKSIKESLEKKDLPKMRDITAYITGEADQLPTGIATLDILASKIEEVRALVAAASHDGPEHKAIALLNFFIAAKYRELTGGIEALEYFDARPSLMTVYTLFGEAGVKSLLENTEVREEKVEPKPGKTHFFEAGGNSFVVYEDNSGQFSLDNEELSSQLVTTLKEKGLDSVLVLTQPDDEQADCKMYILEKDGSVSAMCGNGTRAVGDLYYSKNPDRKEPVKIQTLDGEVVEVQKTENGFRSQLSQVIPLSPETVANYFQGLTSPDFNNQLIHELIDLSGHQGVELREVSQILGEPHMIIATDPKLDREELRKIAQNILAKKGTTGELLFPKGININFAHQSTESEVAVVTYERGVYDFTESCGTGAVCTADLLLRQNPDMNVTIHNPGAKVSVSRANGHYYLEGPAQRIQ